MRQSIAPATLTPGTILAKRYRIEELIGSGGYASVYRATDMTLGYSRAIKEVTDPDPSVRNQFKLESELLINTKHPNIPHGYNYFEDRGRIYLVMEYISGKDLEEHLNDSLTQRGRPLEEEQVLRWMLDICGALIEVHNLPVPIIHRDIKPANIKITPDGRPVLIDFGLAKLQRVGRPTMTAAQGVSPGFAPPEQYMAKGRTDARTDVYGLGATFYACLTGKDPPEAPARLLAQTGAKGHSNGKLWPIRHYNPRVSELTERLVMRSLELSPGQRQHNAEQFEQEITEALRALDYSSSGGYAVPTWTCPRCGTVNSQNIDRCSYCHGAKVLGDSSGRHQASPLPDLTGKRGTVGAAAAANAGSSLGSAKSPAVRRPRAAKAAQQEDAPTTLLDRPSTKQPAVSPRTAQQPAVLPQTGQQPAAQVRTAQQPAISPRTAQQPAVSPRTAQQPAARGYTGQQPAVSDYPAFSEQQSYKGPIALPQRSTGQQPAVQPGPMDQRSGKHVAFEYGGGYTGGSVVAGLGASPAGSAVAMRASAHGPAVSAPDYGVASEPTRLASAVAVGERSASVGTKGSWLRLGQTPLSGFGRWMLALAGIEILWGAVVLAVGILVVLTQGRAFPMQQFVIAWVVVVLLVSILGGQTIARPVYRRGHAPKARRIVQGVGLTLYAVAVHAVAVWGASIFMHAQANPMLAVAAFMLFGLNVFVVGILSLVNILS